MSGWIVVLALLALAALAVMAVLLNLRKKQIEGLEAACKRNDYGANLAAERAVEIDELKPRLEAAEVSLQTRTAELEEEQQRGAQARIERDMLQLRLRQPRQAVFRQYQAMGEMELMDAFRTAPDHPLWKAIGQLIDQKILNRCNDAGVIGIPEREQVHHVGGYANLLELKAEIQEWIESAVRDEEKAEKTGT